MNDSKSRQGKSSVIQTHAYQRAKANPMPKKVTGRKEHLSLK